MDKTIWSFLRKSILRQMKQEAHSRSLFSRTVWFPVIIFQAVRLIREWMEEKLQTYSRRDTECLNHNTWMISCKLTSLYSARSEPQESWAVMPHKMVVLIQIYQFQVPDHDELLEKWPRCETNIYWVEKSAERHGNPAQGETCDEHDNLSVLSPN